MCLSNITSNLVSKLQCSHWRDSLICI